MHLAPSRRLVAHLEVAAAVILSSACCAQAHEPLPPWQEPTGWPDRIIVNFDGDPTRGFAITWRTDATIGTALVQIVKSTGDARFDLQATTKEAKTETVQLGKLATPAGPAIRGFNQGFNSVHYHSASFNDLDPDTLYAWRVRGRLGRWSEWFQTRTLPVKGPIKFVYFGDAQNGIRSHWSRVIRAAHATAGDAAFYLHAGDLVDKGDHDRDWAEWFAAGGHLHGQIPSVPVVGNHEYIPVLDRESGKKKRV
ncbi:FN3 domain-containing metallophosphoesterase family protein, partial [Pirellulales bacterium]|nr:FN3 domain-containing metallophosphoesterase family protein [Pirellulales bacterium]